MWCREVWAARPGVGAGIEKGRLAQSRKPTATVRRGPQPSRNNDLPVPGRAIDFLRGRGQRGDGTPGVPRGLPPL